MAGGIHRLTPLQVAKATKTKHDGGGLYLKAKKNKKTGTIARSWAFRYTRKGEPYWMGLGSLNDFDLNDAREAARICRQQRSRGLDPVDERDKQRQQQAAQAARSMTFEPAAKLFI